MSVVPDLDFTQQIALAAAELKRKSALAAVGQLPEFQSATAAVPRAPTVQELANYDTITGHRTVDGHTQRTVWDRAGQLWQDSGQPNATRADVDAASASARPSLIARTLARLATPGTRTTIVCPGDSVTQSGHYGLTDLQGWTGVLAQLLAARYPLHKVEYVTLTSVAGANALYELDMAGAAITQVQGGDGIAGVIRVVREGIGGASISRLITRSKALWSGVATTPDLVLQMTGINDSLFGAGHSEPAEYTRILSAFVRQVRAYTTADVALMSAHWNGAALGSPTNRLLDPYVAAVHTVAAQEGTAYVPVREEWLAHNLAVGGAGLKGQGDRYNSLNTRDPGDDAHPGPTGHAAIAQCVFDALFGPLAPQGLAAAPARSSTRRIAVDDASLNYSGNWTTETLAGYDGTTFLQRVSRTSGDTLSFVVRDATQAQMLAQMLHINPASVSVSVNGNAQPSISLAAATSYFDDAGTSIHFAPGQAYPVFGGGSPPDPYTVVLTNQGGEWRLDGLLLEGVRPIIGTGTAPQAVSPQGVAAPASVQAVRVQKNAAQTYAGAYAVNVVAFQVTAYGSGWNAQSQGYVAPQAGLYLISGAIGINNFPAGTRLIFYPQINGKQAGTFVDASYGAAGDTAPSGTLIVKLAAGDLLQVVARSPQAFTSLTPGDPADWGNADNLTIYYLGALPAGGS